MLSRTEVDRYRSDGYVHVEGLLSAEELKRLQTATERLIRYASSEVIPSPDFVYQPSSDSGLPTLRSIVYPKRRAIEFQALYGHPGLLEIYESILGPDFVVTDDLLVVKMPGDGVEVSWHRDLAPGMRRAGDSLTAPGIDLDYSSLDNGCVRVLPGSHKLDLVDIAGLVTQHGFDLPDAIPVESKPGDVVVHTGNLVHASPHTDAHTLRRTIYITAFAIDEYMSLYQATPELVRLHRQWIKRAIQMRQQLDYTEGETPYEPHGSPEWNVDVEPDDHVEWSFIASRPAITAS